MEAYDDDGTKLIPCEYCENGTWFTECCNGAGGCSCHGELVNMGNCHVCNGTGWRRLDANIRANSDFIRMTGACFAGSGPKTGYWSNKPALGY